jgi:hypothetical protein
MLLLSDGSRGEGESGVRQAQSLGYGAGIW